MQGRRILVVHQRKDWDSAVQRLLDLSESSFPYWRVDYSGTALPRHLPNYWMWDEVWSEDGALLLEGYDRELALEMINPTNYCSLFSAHIV